MSAELKVELEKIGIKITENLSNKQLRRIYLDNKKNSSDNVGSGAEQVDAAQTNDASVNSSGLVNIGNTETIRLPILIWIPTVQVRRWIYMGQRLVRLRMYIAHFHPTRIKTKYIMQES